ncbi:pterin 4 alpha carbinolamine dehydratase-domain-containing protein [Xylaria arbuscula]|nr:pterin 4 alpha carbinolamine dehydratase-domain-containing protein [Xylaria arbuscula]
MFVRHASLPLRHLSAVAGRGAALQNQTLTQRMTSRATRASPFALTIPRSQMSSQLPSSSSSVGGVVVAPNDAKVTFAAGADAATLTAALQDLLDSAGNGGRWTLIPSGQGLERGFRFKNFTKTWDFMTAVALQCKLKNHHPEWSNVYNTTHIRWTTHSPAGLSAKDVELAQLCDALAHDFGEVINTTTAADAKDDAGGGSSSSSVKQVTDRVVGIAGDCCTPKKSTTTTT